MSCIKIVGTVGVPACYGGFETLVENLLDESDSEHDITVYCSSKSYVERVSFYKNAKTKYIPLEANGLQSILYDTLSIFHAVTNGGGNVLILGVSGAVCLPLVRLFSRAQIITNIDGIEWRRDKWSSFAKWFLKFSEKVAVHYSDVVVSDNQAISDYVKKEYGIESTVIAYGGDHAVTDELQLSDQGYALALCRIEPENNVEMILEGFSHTDKKIIFIGNWDNSTFGREIRSKYSHFDNIKLLDPIYDVERLFEIRKACSFYIHGHSAGGTNPSLVEMMHFAKNIVAFDCDYNRASTEEQALFFSSVDELVEVIGKSQTVEYGRALKEIAERRYTWKIVKEQYFSLFK